MAHHLTVADTSCTNGTVECVNREVLRRFRAILDERRRPVGEWPTMVPAVRWALNTAFHEWVVTTPFQLMMGRSPWTAPSVLAGDGDDEWLVQEGVSAGRMQESVAE